MSARSVGLALGLALLLTQGCGAPQPEVPHELLGRWTTDDPRFEGRALELRPGSVTFVTGIEPPTTHQVVGVTAGSTERLFEIRYLVEANADLVLALRLDPTAGSMSLENRPEVRWKREDA